MANTYVSNVWTVDTTGALATVMHTIAIKLVAGSNTATLTLKSDASASGTTLYTISTGAGTEKIEYVEIHDAAGFYATLTGTSPTAYLYNLARTSYQYFPGFQDPIFHGTVNTDLTASKAIVTDASKNLAASATSATEIGYVTGVTSAIQTQMDLKAPKASPTFTGTATAPNLCVTTKLEVSYSAAGSSLGSVVKKVQIFDASGVSLGYLPVYDAIT